MSHFHRLRLLAAYFSASGLATALGLLKEPQGCPHAEELDTTVFTLSASLPCLATPAISPLGHFGPQRLHGQVTHLAATELNSRDSRQTHLDLHRQGQTNPR